MEAKSLYDTSEVYASITQAPPDGIFGIVEKYNKEMDIWKALPAESKNQENKPENISIGAYRDNSGKPWVLPSVKKIEASLAADPAVNHEYLSITGLPEFTKLSQELLFGTQSENIATIQSLSGTGALFVGFTFLKIHMGIKRIIVSDPTWVNHKSISEAANLEYDKYPYYDSSNNSVKVDAMIEAIRNAPADSAIILHACAHNPTGMDLDHDSWNRVLNVFEERMSCAKERGHVYPFFDCAYQGYASGNVNEDAYAIRLFAQRGIPMAVAQSFSKTMGLYSERCGGLHIVCGPVNCKNFETTVAKYEASDSNANKQYISAAVRVKSQLSVIARRTYSNPPAHGARIAACLLSSSEMREEWTKDLQQMTTRLITMRESLKNSLDMTQADKAQKGLMPKEKIRDWSHITAQKGMFSYTGLSADHVEYLARVHKIFMTKDGRISISGLNEGNVGKISNAFIDAIINC